MTPEEIKALISETLNTQLPQVLKTAMGEFSSHFEGQLNDLAGTLQKPQELPEVDDKDPMAQRLKMLEAKLAEQEAAIKARETEAQQLRFSNTLGSALAGKGNVLHQKLVSEILSNRLKDGAVEKNGEWYTKDGLKLSEAVESFFGSDEGLHFLPSDHQNGTATPGSRQPASTSQPNPKDLSFEEMIKEVYW